MQQTLDLANGFERYGKQTRRAGLLLSFLLNCREETEVFNRVVYKCSRQNGIEPAVGGCCIVLIQDGLND